MDSLVNKLKLAGHNVSNDGVWQETLTSSNIAVFLQCRAQLKGVSLDVGRRLIDDTTATYGRSALNGLNVVVRDTDKIHRYGNGSNINFGNHIRGDINISFNFECLANAVSGIDWNLTVSKLDSLCIKIKSTSARVTLQVLYSNSCNSMSITSVDSAIQTLHLTEEWDTELENLFIVGNVDCISNGLDLIKTLNIHGSPPYIDDPLSIANVFVNDMPYPTTKTNIDKLIYYLNPFLKLHRVGTLNQLYRSFDLNDSEHRELIASAVVKCGGLLLDCENNPALTLVLSANMLQQLERLGVQRSQIDYELAHDLCCLCSQNFTKNSNLVTSYI